ncbi:unnamed protein product [Citrullus colocynthis]|uniref:Thionin-like protein 2 n=1 Tax=Citrullus colocynthis TaxID=252529 RepID=A0ABP0XU39_9ROSI
MKSILVFCLVVSLVVVVKSEGAGNGNVGGGGSCYLSCILNDCQKGVFQCAVCIGKCAINLESYSMKDRQMDNRDFCKIGCSTSVCSKFAISDNQYSDEREVKACLNSCNQRCTDNMY